jgi:anthranilate phosphoribosyltransferase
MVEKVEIRDVLGRLLSGKDLEPSELEGVVRRMMEGGCTDAQSGAFLTALRAKGESASEIAVFARILREKAVRIAPKRRPLVDTCGTGGDGSGTFNISTVVAFVVAGAGVAVAKHGNRSITSRSGSADCLEALGVRIDLSPERVSEAIDMIGIGFLFAPQHHPLLKEIGRIRRELGVRTIFNILGPLANPAGAEAQLVGVFDPELTEPVAEALGRLGARRAMVVHGQGLDEITLEGPTRISEWDGERVKTFLFDPNRLGMRPASKEALRGGTPQENARLAERILKARDDTAATEVVLVNAAAALHVAGAASGMSDGLAQARVSLDEGRAWEKLEALREFSRASFLS